MTGYCRLLRTYYGAQFDPSNDTWSAVKVRQDGVPVVIDDGFASEDAAADCAELTHVHDLRGLVSGAA